jgi:Beta-lactamase class C and other penicillin binding proteins
MKATIIQQDFPSNTGISPVYITNFINELEEKHVPMHSLLIARYNKLILEAYWQPFHKDMLHRMFSITKSFTSIAIGILIDDNMISLDDPIVKYFPEYIPENPHEFLTKMTIRHMLTMQTCHASTTYKTNLLNNWVESFFVTAPSHPAGTIFKYDTSASHTLCALVEKLTGMNLLDFLRLRCLDKIGFSKEAYIIKDPFETSMGGSGLMAKPTDILKFALLLMNNGYFENKQLIPAKYILEATKKQTDTAATASIFEESLGYGYQIWRASHNAYILYGMGGQYAICFPDYELICTTTADTQGISGNNQYIFDALYKNIILPLSNSPNNITDNLITCTKHDLNLASLIKKLKIPALTSCNINFNITKTIYQNINNRVYCLKPNLSKFDTISFTFNIAQNSGSFNYERFNQRYSIPFGINFNVHGIYEEYNQSCISSASWVSSNVLHIKSFIIDESLGSLYFSFTFYNDNISVFIKRTNETLFEGFNGFLHS